MKSQHRTDCSCGKVQGWTEPAFIIKRTNIIPDNEKGEPDSPRITEWTDDDEEEERGKRVLACRTINDEEEDTQTGELTKGQEKIREWRRLSKTYEATGHTSPIRDSDIHLARMEHRDRLEVNFDPTPCLTPKETEINRWWEEEDKEDQTIFQRGRWKFLTRTRGTPAGPEGIHGTRNQLSDIKNLLGEDGIFDTTKTYPTMSVEEEQWIIERLDHQPENRDGGKTFLIHKTESGNIGVTEVDNDRNEPRRRNWLRILELERDEEGVLRPIKKTQEPRNEEENSLTVGQRAWNVIKRYVKKKGRNGKFEQGSTVPNKEPERYVMTTRVTVSTNHTDKGEEIVRKEESEDNDPPEYETQESPGIESHEGRFAEDTDERTREGPRGSSYLRNEKATCESEEEQVSKGERETQEIGERARTERETRREEGELNMEKGPVCLPEQTERKSSRSPDEQCPPTRLKDDREPSIENWQKDEGRYEETSYRCGRSLFTRKNLAKPASEGRSEIRAEEDIPGIENLLGQDGKYEENETYPSLTAEEV